MPSGGMGGQPFMGTTLPFTTNMGGRLALRCTSAAPSAIACCMMAVRGEALICACISTAFIGEPPLMAAGGRLGPGLGECLLLEFDGLTRFRHHLGGHVGAL